jgi:nucleoside-diphosphate-sugar epimerase
MSDRVLVTGASGFLGSHTTLALLRAGYHVRASARDVARSATRFEAFVPSDLRARVTLVPLDLASDAGCAAATADCAYVVHTASPVPKGPVRDPAEVIEPAREGTHGAIRAMARRSTTKPPGPSSDVT